MSAPAALIGVAKSFGERDALVDVSYETAQGEILAVLGPNGAGKTTSISLLLGLRRPDRGEALLFGDDPRAAQARLRVGATPQEMGFPSTLRVGELVELVRAHYPAPSHTDELLRTFGLEGLAGRQAGGLSGGEKRRLAVALAFAGAPDLVILDEPTTGLDPEGRGSVWATLRGFAARGGSALLTTHYLEEAEALADSIVVIDAGRVVARGSIEAIRSRAGGSRISFAAEPLPSGLTATAVLNGRVVLETTEPERLVRQLVHAGAALAGLEVTPLPLEDALRRLPGEPS